MLKRVLTAIGLIGAGSLTIILDGDITFFVFTLLIGCIYIFNGDLDNCDEIER